MSLRLDASWLALLATVLPLSLHAESAAPSADPSMISTALQRDAQGNSSSIVAMRQPIGPGGWVQAGLGQATLGVNTSAARTRSQQASLGAGVAVERWQVSANVAQRREGDRLRQRNLHVGVERRIGQGGAVGLDATRRELRAQDAGAGRAGAANPVTRRLTGHGLGLRVAVAVTERITIYGALQKSLYGGGTETTGSPTGSGVLGSLLPAVSRVTVVNREDAALTRSQLAGASVRLHDRAEVSAEVAQDRLLGGGTLRSGQLRAAITLGDSGWTLAPGAGVSRSDAGASVASASLRASYVW